MILKVKHLKKHYRGAPVVNDLSFSVGTGEVVGLLGPNGAGKTTAFYMVMGLIKPDEGSVTFDEKDITHKSVARRARMGMGYLAQEPSVFRNLTVEDNIRCILQTLPLTKSEGKARLKELICELNLERVADKKACLLSGGERRRLEITRALVTHPRLLLLDEPFANIDPITIYDVKEMIRFLKERGISVLITDHNAREIASIVDYSFLIQGGRVTDKGTINELLTNADAKATYFGQNFSL